jgi:hypothetical protein
VALGRIVESGKWMDEKDGEEKSASDKFTIHFP